MENRHSLSMAMPFKRVTYAVLLCLLTAAGAWAQLIPTGSISGVVKDPKGAVVPGATITITNTETGVAKTTKTNSTGEFLATSLLPGTYRVTARMRGFKAISQVGSVQTGESTTFNLTLQLGSTRQTVEVSSRAPLLQTTTSSLTTNVSTRAIETLPLQGRNPLLLERLSPGVVQTFNPGPSGVDVNAMNQTSYFTSNGAWDRDNDFMIDGVPDNLTDRVGYIPPVDDTASVTVLTNAYDAQYGHGAGATVIVTTKGGTNHFHGTVYDFMQNSVFNANSFFNNLNGIRKVPSHYNQFGGALGEPSGMTRPSFSLTMKEFAFRIRHRLSGACPRRLSGRATSPRLMTEAEASDPDLQSLQHPADPNNPGNYIRDQFNGNIIPTGPTGMIQPCERCPAFFDSWDRPGTGALASDNLHYTDAQNYATTIQSSTPMNDYTIRVDNQINDSNRFFVRFSREKTNQLTSSFYPKLPASSRFQEQISVGTGFSHIFSPTLALDVALGWEGWRDIATTPSFDLSSLGFSSSFINELPGQTVPSVNVADFGGFGYGTFGYHDIDPTWGFNANMRYMRGKQSIKWGFQFQVKQDNSGIYGDTGTFNFGRSYTQGPDPSATGPNVGYGVASFLLGTMDNSSNLQSASNEATTAPYYAAYLQDNLRATSKLSLNLGVRWEVWLPATERYNRQITGFAFDQPNPIAAQAIANYAANPIPGNILPPDQFKVDGGFYICQSEWPAMGQDLWNSWSPRVGFAYRVTNKTVIRGGFGYFRSMFWTSFARQTGFESQDLCRRKFEWNQSDRPFQQSYPQVLTRSHRFQPRKDDGAGKRLRDSRPECSAWVQRALAIGFQRQLTPSTLLAAYYVGETAFHLPVGSGGQIFTPAGNAEQDYQINYLPAKYLSLGENLYNLVPNPFYGLISTAGFNGPTIHEGQLLLKYPAFTSIDNARKTAGRTYYDWLQIAVTKRYSKGLSLLGAYTWSKSIDRYRYINASDPAPSKMIGYYDAPQRFTLGGTYDLPFGPGKPFGWKSGVGAKIFGGWRVGVNGVFQSGLPIPMNSPTILTGVNPTLSAGKRSRLDWFNTSAIAPLGTFSLRSAPWVVAGLRGDAIDNWDTSLVKNFRLTERFGLQFRWEMYNAFNRVQFANPDVNPNSAAVGTISSQANTPRQMQMALKLSF